MSSPFLMHISRKAEHSLDRSRRRALAFVGRGPKVRTCSVLQLSALSKFREMAPSNSQEQEPDNNY